MNRRLTMARRATTTGRGPSPASAIAATTASTRSTFVSESSRRARASLSPPVVMAPGEQMAFDRRKRLGSACQRHVNTDCPPIGRQVDKGQYSAVGDNLLVAANYSP